MRPNVRIEYTLNIASIQQAVERKTETIVGRIAKKGEKLSKYNAPYDTGELEESIEAEPTEQFGKWGVHARTPYALIQELQQPYLYGSVLESAGNLKSATRGLRFKKPSKSNKQRGKVKKGKSKKPRAQKPGSKPKKVKTPNTQKTKRNRKRVGKRDQRKRQLTEPMHTLS